MKPKKEKAKPKLKKKTVVKQKKEKPKPKKKASVKQKKGKGSRSQRNLQRRRLWEGSQNEERSKDDVPGVDWLGVIVDKNFSYIFNLTFFIHIFEGNRNFKNEYPVKIF